MLNTEQKRQINRKLSGTITSDGAGVRLTRYIGSRELMDLDPFLLFDEFKSDNPDDYIGGFPDHPHRGFETVTYMIAGKVDHADSAGNSGTLKPGGAQWMTAGRGLIHSELPKQEDGLLWGFQLWVNLPADSKMVRPRYQDIEPEEIPKVTIDSGVVVRVLAGEVFGAKGPVEGIATRPLYLDVSLPAGAATSIPVDRKKAAFAYVVEGAGEVGKEQLEAGTLAELGAGESIDLVGGEAGLRILIVAAKPLNEPIARWGPFVMNTNEQIEQAIEDYRNGSIKA